MTRCVILFQSKYFEGKMQDKYLEFITPTRVVYQCGGAAQASDVLGRIGIERPYVVADEGVARAGVVESVMQSLSPAGLFLEVPPDGDLETAERIASEMKAKNADGLLALGGGSVIDTAKGANIVFTLGGKLEDHQGVGVLPSRLSPFVVIPTTAGTGSEVSRVAALKDRSIQQKLFFESEYLAADIALLDPEVTRTLPPKLTAATGMDALTHAVEALLSANSGPLTDALALHAVQSIFKWLPVAVGEGENLEARSQMLFASTAAGAAFSSAGVGVVHACSHGLGVLCGLHHGLANSIMLPHGVRFNLTGPHPTVPKEMPDRLTKLAQDCGLPTTLREVDVLEERLPAVAEYAEGDASMIYNPVPADAGDLLKVLRNAY